MKLVHRLPLRIAVLSLIVVCGLATFRTQPTSVSVLASDPEKPAPAKCHRAKGSIQIDGKLDEPAWKNAETLDGFTAHWLDQKARTATKARLLWDERFLYFSAEMEDQDLYADITEQDGMAWLNDVFELFFKPADERPGYYEFQVNAANTKLDMYLPSRGAGGYQRFARSQDFQMDTAVVRAGTLNQWQDKDQGWQVEGRIPWTDFKATGGAPQSGDQWKFALCRYDYSVAFESADLTSTAPLTRPDFHRYEDYGSLEFVGDK